MRLGITGATGFVGRALVREAGLAGHRVVAFSRRPEVSVAGADEVRDFRDPAATNLKGLDAVIHLAGESVAGLWTRRKKALIGQSRVNSTRGLVEALKKTKEGPGVLVCASGTGYYGDRGDEVLDEDTDGGFGFLAEVCREWEGAARKAEKEGARVVCCRLGMVLGPGGGALAKLSRVFSLGLGGKLGKGSQWMPWIHAEDAARLFLRALSSEEPWRGPVNAVAGAVSNAEFTRTLASLLHRPAFLPAPAWALRHLLPGGMHEMLLFSQRAEPLVAKLSGFTWRHPEFGEAMRLSLPEKPEASPVAQATAGTK